MSRFLFACYPIAGHLHPSLAIAQALRERGHEVAIYSGALARESVLRAGFAFFGYDPEMDRRLTATLLPAQVSRSAASLTSSGSLSPLVRLAETKATLHDWFLATVPQQIDDLRAISAHWHPDALLADISLFGPFLVLHERGPIPVAALCVVPGCPIPGPDAPTWGRGLPPPRGPLSRLQSSVERAVQDRVLADFRAAGNALRARYALPPVSGPAMALLGRLPLCLVAGAPEFDYERRDLPPTVQYVGHCSWGRPSDEPPPDWLGALPRGQPIVHATEGTVHVRQPFVLRAAAQGLGGSAMQVVMTTGAHRDPAELDLGPRAANLRVERMVAHSDLIPLTDLVITTGGAGTVLTALTHGVPLVVVPTGWDLPENAQRIVEAGVGVRLSPRQCTPRRLRAAVEHVLATPAYRRNARRIGAALARCGGAARAATLLEALVPVAA